MSASSTPPRPGRHTASAKGRIVRRRTTTAQQPRRINDDDAFSADEAEEFDDLSNVPGPSNEDDNADPRCGGRNPTTGDNHDQHHWLDVLRQNYRDADAYVQLACGLSPGSTVDIPSLPVGSATEVPSSSSISPPRRAPFTKVGLYLEALRWQPDHPLALNNLGVAISDDGDRAPQRLLGGASIQNVPSVEWPDGRRLTAVDLWIEAIRCSSVDAAATSSAASGAPPRGACDATATEAAACYNLGVRLPAGEVLWVPDGSTRVEKLQQQQQQAAAGCLMTAKALLRRSVALNPHCALALCELGARLHPGETVAMHTASCLPSTVEHLGVQELLLKALETDSGDPRVWVKIAWFLSPSAMVATRAPTSSSIGSVVDARSALHRVLQSDASHPAASYLLSRLLKEGESWPPITTSRRIRGERQFDKVALESIAFRSDAELQQRHDELSRRTIPTPTSWADTCCGATWFLRCVLCWWG